MNIKLRYIGFSSLGDNLEAFYLFIQVHIYCSKYQWHEDQGDIVLVFKD